MTGSTGSCPRIYGPTWRSGFTTVLSTGDHAGPILRTKRFLETGELSGPRLLVSGPVFTKPDAHPATTICGNFPSLSRDQFTHV